MDLPTLPAVGAHDQRLYLDCKHAHAGQESGNSAIKRNYVSMNLCGSQLSMLFRLGIDVWGCEYEAGNHRQSGSIWGVWAAVPGPPEDTAALAVTQEQIIRWFDISGLIRMHD